MAGLSAHDILVNVAPVIAVGGIVITAASRLWKKFEARLDKGDRALTVQFESLASDVLAHAAADTAQFHDVNNVLSLHANRLSWLEGKAGVPLGSTPKEEIKL